MTMFLVRDLSYGWGGCIEGAGVLIFGANTTEGITSVLGFLTIPSRGRMGVEDIVVEEPIDDSSPIVD